MRERDTQRSRVYKSDKAVVQLSKPLPAVRDVERFVKKVFTSKRVRAAFPKTTRTLPDVKDGRGRSAAGGNLYMITVPRWARSEGIVLHEIAHTVCQREHGWDTVAAHGWQYCAIYLKLVLYAMGREAHDALKAAFRENRVRFTEPRKRQPLDPERRAALIARLASYRAAKTNPSRFAGLELT